MKNNKPNTLITSAITTAVLALSATSVFADSAKIFNPDNSHYYQRFDVKSNGITWIAAKANCSKLKGHLVTYADFTYGVDNAEEQFVFQQLIVNASSFNNVIYFSGAVYDTNVSAWKWITDEPFGSNWGVPKTGYYYLGVTKNDEWYWALGQSNPGNPIYGYICEWDGNNFVSSATVPDLNGNGVDENAALYLDYKNNKHTVVIRDPKTHTTISTLTFATSATPPIGLAVIADTNNNGIPEIAVLSKLNIQVKDAKNNSNVLSSINFLNSKYQPRALSATPDSNNNGFDELTVLGILSSGKATSETLDGDTGEILFSDSF